MKNTLIILFLLFSTTLIAQKRKSIDVARAQFASISLSVSYDKENNPADTTCYLIGQDNRYSQLVDYNTIKVSSLVDMYLFLRETKEFLSLEDDGTSSDIGEVHISVSRAMGIKYIIIWHPESSGYTNLNGMQIKKLMDGIAYFCESKGIKLYAPKK